MALQKTSLQARTADPRGVGVATFTDGASTPTYYRGDVILDENGNPFDASNPLPVAPPAGLASDANLTSIAGAAISGASMPAGGSGLTGWLSAIWSKLSGTLAVSAASLPLPTGAATSAKQDAILAALGSPLQVGGTVNDAQSAPFQGAVAMTVGTTYAAQRSVGVLCTVAGNVQMTLADGSSIMLPVTPGWQTFPFAATQIVGAGTTATATFYNLK